VNRRTFLGVAAAIAAMDIDMNAKTTPIPIIDTHIHLFDPRRPQGIPWPPKDDVKLYQPALPERYLKVTKGQGVVGAIEVECSPWLEDNQWVLDIAAKAPVVVGTVGDLQPGNPDFRKQLERFHRNPLFRGIRCGNLWGRNLNQEIGNPDFVHGLKELAGTGLEMDTANPDPDLIATIVRLTDLVPNLRVVIDHLPQMKEPTDPKVKKDLEANLHELGKRRQVYVKVSEVLRRIGDHLHLDLDFYKPTLDRLWDIFGEDRLIYGSDWPNSDHTETYPQELTLVRKYVLSKGRAAAEKIFWKNSVAAYHWIKRDSQQPDPGTV
jgi:L-fucono-1,5-lactonase